MALDLIDIGGFVNDPSADTTRDAFNKVNTMFTELYRNEIYTTSQTQVAIHQRSSITMKGDDLVYTLKNNLAWAEGLFCEITQKGDNLTFDSTEVDLVLPQTLQNVSGSVYRIQKTGTNVGVDEYTITQVGVATGTGASQVAFNTELVFDGDKSSTFGSTTDNQHTQSGAIVFTYNFTNAIEGATRTLEILSDGNTITLPNANTHAILNHSKTLITITDNVITPVSGENYLLSFWRTNDVVFVIIADAPVYAPDVSAPTLTSATVENATDDVLDFVFSDPVTITTTGWSISTDGAALSISSLLSGDGTTAPKFQLSRSIVDTETVTVSYDDTTGDTVKVANGVELVSIVDDPVINNIIPNFSGLNITRMYFPIKTDLATANNFASLKRFSSTDNPTVTFGTDNAPDFSSVGAFNWFYDKIMCQITAHEISAYNTGAAEADQFCKAYDASTGVVTKNGVAAYSFLGYYDGSASGGVQGTALSELASGNDFTITLIVSNNQALENPAGLSTSLTGSERATVFCSRANDSAGFIRASATNHTAVLDAITNSGDARLLNFVVNGTTGLMEIYLNNTLQTDTGTYTGTYTNDVFRLGADNNQNFVLDGDIIGVIISNAALNSSQVSDLNGRINSRISIY